MTSDRFGANFPRYVAIPSTVSNSSLEVGDGISRIPCVLTGSGRKPSADHIIMTNVCHLIGSENTLVGI